MKQAGRHGENGLATSGRDRTILLVDDDATIRRVVKLLLERRGYHILQAAEGREGLHLSHNFPGPIHLLLTDVEMPSMGGEELAARLQVARPQTKVLYMSGDIAPSSLDAEAFISKPFTPDVLFQKLAHMLEAAT